jgi:hypothetical protein
MDSKHIAAAVAVILGLCFCCQKPKPETPPQEPEKPCPGPVCPKPAPKPTPKPPPSPWGVEGAPVGATVSGFTAPDGTEAHCHLPETLHIRNKGGSDGAGLCVFASLTHSAHWQSIDPLRDLFEWMRKFPGGGWPDKVDQMIARKCKESGTPIPRYVQVEGLDLEFLHLACATGRMPAITYGWSPTGRYGGSKIAHMVTLVHASKDLYGILDNNYPGSIEWMNEKEFIKSHTMVGSGWSVVFLEPGPPSPPRGYQVTSSQEKIHMFVGDCHNCNSPHAQRPAIVSQVETYRWVETSDPDQTGLVKNGKQVGVFVHSTGKYHGYDGVNWTKESVSCPVGLPTRREAKVAKSPACKCEKCTCNPCQCNDGPAATATPQGVDESKLAKVSSPVYRVIGFYEGREPRESLVDDSKLLRVTVNSRDKELGPRVKADLAASDWAGKVLVKFYEPTDWQMSCGYVEGIYVQSPDGTVLHRQVDYKDGVSGLIAALRKTDPKYDPSKDQDKRVSPTPTVTDWLSSPRLWVLGIGAALWFYVRKDK